MEKVLTNNEIYKKNSFLSPKMLPQFINFAIIVLVYFVFFGAFALTSYKLLPLYNNVEVFNPLWRMRENYSMFNISVGPITTNYEHLKVTGSFVREVINEIESIDITIDGNDTYYMDNEIVSVGQRPTINFSANYENMSLFSNYFTLYEYKPKKMNRVNINLFCPTKQLKLITGLFVRYSFVNPDVYRFCKIIRLFISVAVVSTVTPYILDYISNKNRNFDSIFCIVLGISACFSSNPLSLISSTVFGDFFDSFFIAAFFALYRTYITLKITELIFKNPPPTIAKIAAFVTFAIISIISLISDLSDPDFNYLSSYAFVVHSTLNTFAVFFEFLVPLVFLMVSAITIVLNRSHSAIFETISYCSFFIIGSTISLISWFISKRCTSAYWIFPRLIRFAGNALVVAIVLIFNKVMVEKYQNINGTEKVPINDIVGFTESSTYSAEENVLESSDNY